ncbi:MAG: hypothetical protein KDB14_16970 [Planctomycetales bacterium]|nr:hypothetical protein [Planctomycetales bacterium]
MTPLIASLFLLGSLPYNQLWYAVPLIAAISLVYGATRDEQMGPILTHAYRSVVMVAGFLLTMFGVLWIVSWFV